MARHEGSASSEREDERPYDHGREDRGTGVEIVQDPQLFPARQVHSRLLARLPNRRGLEVQVAGGVTAARESDLTGPGIVGPLGAPDEQDLETVRAFQQDERDRGGSGGRGADPPGGGGPQPPPDGCEADNTRCFPRPPTNAPAPRTAAPSRPHHPAPRTPP